MKAKKGCPIVLVGIVSLVVAGCREPAAEPSPLGAERPQEMRRAAPNLSGFSQDMSFGKDPTALIPRVEAALKDSGIRVVRTGTSEAGPWLLGKSLADRDVLVQILPVYPGCSRIHVQVQGNDPLARELLKHLFDGIVAQQR